ncbi:nucleotidyl transferase AbiEii/AbiGii toxin family protein [Acinetobacter sp.]|uniref:nucleotidyl transferase AbiEii/AbiGii toxin family protein n=1 Tax=Acinetobacter sp. TaxID=472 RepID=UPI0031D324D3
MSDIKNLFTDVADALGIGATSIVEKDYYVVELLKILQPLKFDSHDLVFAGGTSLAKASIQLNRMSEDVDIKIVPKSEIVLSRSQSKVVRKQLFQQIQEEISKSNVFMIEGKPIVNDEYRYIELLIRYPQTFNQSPCLRPFIKLELVETNLLEPFEKRNITSFVYDLTQQGCIVDSFPCVTIASTSIEKLIAILRRTAAFARNAERVDDESLVRHIYDYFKITHGDHKILFI